MSYSFKLTGEKVFLDVIANADESILKLQTDGCRIIKLSFPEFFNICHVIGYKPSDQDLFTLFVRNNAFVNLTENEKVPSIIVLESYKDPYTAFRLLDTLKLYKPLDIYSCHSVNYIYTNDTVKFGGYGKVLNIIPEHTFVLSERYSLNPEEAARFPAWYSLHHKMVSKRKVNAIFANTITFYIRSFSIPDPSASFLMLMIVLEMIFCSENVELSYRIKRGCSYFLSSNREEMENLLQRIAALYNARSKYVHKGESVKLELLYELREITRKVLVTMFDRNMYTEEFSFKKFREDLTYCGYEK